MYHFWAHTSVLASDCFVQSTLSARPSAFVFATSFPTYWPDTTNPITKQPSILMVYEAFLTYAPTIDCFVGTGLPFPPLAINMAYRTTFGLTTTFCQTYDSSPRPCTSDELFCSIDSVSVSTSLTMASSVGNSASSAVLAQSDLSNNDQLDMPNEGTHIHQNNISDDRNNISDDKNNISNDQNNNTMFSSNSCGTCLSVTFPIAM